MNIGSSISLPEMGNSLLPQVATAAGAVSASRADMAQNQTAPAAASGETAADDGQGEGRRLESASAAGRERDPMAGLTPEEQQEVRELAARDREVRAHEQAHANVGGQYAGAPSYTYERAPDGRQYAVGGEVSIDVSPVPGDPQATIDKARIVRRAALAPAEPSSQDRAVAAEATKMEQQARADLLAQSAQAEESSAYGKPGVADTLFYVAVDVRA